MPGFIKYGSAQGIGIHKSNPDKSDARVYTLLYWSTPRTGTGMLFYVLLLSNDRIPIIVHILSPLKDPLVRGSCS